MKSDNSVLQRLAPEFAGLCIGIQILMKALDKVHDFQAYPLPIGFLFLSGLFVMAASIYNCVKKSESKHSHALFHLLEGVAIIVSALILFDKGKFRMPAFLAFIGIIYLIIGVIGYKLNKDNFKKYGRPLLKWIGTAFMIFGLVAVIWNWNYDKDKWVFGIGVMFILIGSFYFLFAGWILSKAEKKLDQEKTGHGS